MIITPTIYEIKDNFSYEINKQNNPKMILIIENKRISEESIIEAEIDYDNHDTTSVNNIARFFNIKHQEMILDYCKENLGKFTSNFNFAYHYLIDKKGNIYKGRDHNVRPFNLDIYDMNNNGEYEVKDPFSSIFSNFIIILLEDNSDKMNIVNESYDSLVTLIRYLRYKTKIKEYYSYSEMNRFDLEITNDENKSNLKYNNPGIFFKINEIRSSVDTYLIEKLNISPFNIETYTYGGRVLKYVRPITMKGNDVIQLQILLYRLNLLNDFKLVSGEYNYITSQAIKEFQKLNYITPKYDYGIADINTQKILMNKVYKKKIENFKSMTDDNSLFRILEYREDNIMTGDDVCMVQSLLKEKVSCLQEISSYYDKNTENNIKIFQNYMGITEDGKCNHYIYNLLKNSKLQAIDENIKPFSISGYNIVILQKALNYIGANLKINGQYDLPTQTVIAQINSNKKNLELMGIGDKELNTDLDLKICYKEEYDYLIKNYFFKNKNSIVFK